MMFVTEIKAMGVLTILNKKLRLKTYKRPGEAISVSHIYAKIVPLPL